jgi:hypothetical protein
MAGKVGSRRGEAAAVLALLSLSVLLVAGCGGSSSGATGVTAGESTERSPASEGSSTSSSPPPSSSQPESRTSPPTPGFSKKAKLAAFGYEAEASDQEEASDILERSLKARAAGDYATQCETLSQPVVEAVERARYRQNCVNTLKIGDLLTPPAKTVNTMQGPIVALRVKGAVGYALYHGKDGDDYAMRMELENGEWKVGEVLTENLP